jgi:hypothetical protein
MAVENDSKSFLENLSPPIEVKVGLCPSYSRLLRGEHSEVGSVDDLLKWAVGRGRVIVSGRGASGKSALIYRAALKATEKNFAAYVIGLSRWDQAATEEWKQVRGISRDALDFLLRRFSSSGQDVSDAEFLPPSVQKIFFVDGLNETPGSVADEILSACDEVATIMVGASFIVSDRLVRRGLSEERKWRFVMPLPVEQCEVDKLLSGKVIPDRSKSLLDSPFFLDRAIKGELRDSPLATIKELVESRGKLDARGLGDAALAAYNAYKIEGSRTFSIDRFSEVGNREIADTLIAGGILVPAGSGLVAFTHHWYHDYLASKYVSERPELWSFENRHDVLDTLTFRANSFDAVAFVLEMLPTASTGGFIQAVYDWNPYAAGYALAEARIRVNDVPRDVRLIILAMLAERRFDRHYYSAIRASDALDLLGDVDALQMRSAKSLPELQSLISKIESSSEAFSAWRELFVQETGKSAPNELLANLENENSILGWTTANVLKRLKMNDQQLGALAKLAREGRPVVRWRAVHVMGGFVNTGLVGELLNRLDNDGDENVRYGSLRSLIELASRDDQIVSSIVDALCARLVRLKASSRLLNELVRAVFLSKGFAPSTWSEQISRLFYGLLDLSNSADEAQRWSGMASKLRVHLRSTPQVAA